MTRRSIKGPRDCGGGLVPDKALQLKEENSDNKAPVFSFAHCTGRQYRLDEWKKEELRSLVSSLQKMSLIAWKDIRRDGGLRYEVDVDLAKTARRVLPESVPKDCPIDSFRASEKARVWGYRATHVFYVIWFDRNHAVCPEGKHKR